MFVLSINLLISLLPNEKWKLSIFKRRITRNIKILEYITQHRVKTDYSEFKIINEKSEDKVQAQVEEIDLAMSELTINVKKSINVSIDVKPETGEINEQNESKQSINIDACGACPMS